MKIGLLYNAYNSIDYLERQLIPWEKFKEKSSHELVIGISDGKFSGYSDDNPNVNSNDGTSELLKKKFDEGVVNFLLTENSQRLEHEIRSDLSQFLILSSCDVIMLSGTDEMFEVNQIENIFNFVGANYSTAYFSIFYKNLVFDEKHWIDFCPSRIWRVAYGNYKLTGFYWDDDMFYTDREGKIVKDKALPTRSIPKFKAYVKHETWLSNKRSKEKVEYHNKHFAHGAGCSYKWNYELNRLEFNEEYYKKTGQAIPVLLTE